MNGLTPFLKQCGYNLKKEVTFLPLAALYGHNIRDPVGKEQCDGYEGGTLFQVGRGRGGVRGGNRGRVVQHRVTDV